MSLMATPQPLKQATFGKWAPTDLFLKERLIEPMAEQYARHQEKSTSQATKL